jgi:serine/threonine-protein phosphatase CPPED1
MESKVPRFHNAQVNRSIIHPLLCQPPSKANVSTDHIQPEILQFVQPTTLSHTFVVAADTQLGMTNENRDWEVEIEYSRQAIQRINALQPRPLFCCICGDLVDMCSEIYNGKPKRLLPKQKSDSTSDQVEMWTEIECDTIQEQQVNDMKNIWNTLHPSIALICLCGNHDVGNRPTSKSIERFTSRFGDDYLAFFVNGTYNIVLNSALFSDPTDALPLYTAQLEWLEQRLLYAHKYSARNIFLFSHHPWFLHNEDEDVDDLQGRSYLSPDFYVSDSYFPIPKIYRQRVMTLCRLYNVSACFSGHFHQNMVSQSTSGMQMIITGALSMVLQSSGNPNVRNEPSTQGFRIVTVEHNATGGTGTFHHRFVSLSTSDESSNGT